MHEAVELNNVFNGVLWNSHPGGIDLHPKFKSCWQMVVQLQLSFGYVPDIFHGWQIQWFSRSWQKCNILILEESTCCHCNMQCGIVLLKHGPLHLLQVQKGDWPYFMDVTSTCYASLDSHERWSAGVVCLVWILSSQCLSHCHVRALVQPPFAYKQMFSSF